MYGRGVSFDAMRRRRLLLELVGPVARSDSDREGVAARLFDELAGLFGVGQVILRLLFREARALAVLDAAEAAELCLDCDAARVRGLNDLSRDLDVVVPARGGLAVLFEGAVHHHGGEVHIHRADAGRGRVAVVLVHSDGDVRVELRGGDHQVPQVVVVRVRARTTRGLDDDGRLRLVRRHHDRLDLLLTRPRRVPGTDTPWVVVDGKLSKTEQLEKKKS